MARFFELGYWIRKLVGSVVGFCRAPSRDRCLLASDLGARAPDAVAVQGHFSLA